MMRVIRDVKCRIHPRYKAVRKPKVPCSPCWAYYLYWHANEWAPTLMHTNDHFGAH